MGCGPSAHSSGCPSSFWLEYMAVVRETTRPPTPVKIGFSHIGVCFMHVMARAPAMAAPKPSVATFSLGAHWQSTLGTPHW